MRCLHSYLDICLYIICLIISEITVLFLPLIYKLWSRNLLVKRKLFYCEDCLLPRLIRRMSLRILFIFQKILPWELLFSQGENTFHFQIPIIIVRLNYSSCWHLYQKKTTVNIVTTILISE